MTIILLISFLWAYLEGKREAQYFHYKWGIPNPTKIKDEHLEFTIQRSLYVIISSLLVGFIFEWWSSIILFISLAFTFSFLHNGSYYKRRNELNENVYPYRWKDESTTTTAKFSFSYKSRLIQFIIGVILCLGFDLFILIK
jgi:hypothetical protein